MILVRVFAKIYGFMTFSAGDTALNNFTYFRIRLRYVWTLTNSITPLARFSGSDDGFFFILPTPG